MKLKDFLSKSIPDITVSIKLPSGEDSGETLTIVNPSSGFAVSAMRAYQAANSTFQREHAELKAKCEESKDFSEYNALAVPFFEELDRDFATEITCGWSMDDEFTTGAVSDLFESIPSVVGSVIAAYWEAAAALEKK